MWLFTVKTQSTQSENINSLNRSIKIQPDNPVGFFYLEQKIVKYSIELGPSKTTKNKILLDNIK